MLIADACCNHLGDDRIIDRMIELCPTPYIKFQLFDVSELSKEWEADYEYYKRCQLTDAQVLRILAKCSVKGVLPIFTVFTKSQLYRAHGLGVKRFKVASPTADNAELVNEIVAVSDWTVISTGMSEPRTIRLMLSSYPEAIILKCISKYPAVWTEQDKREALFFDGISDHSFDLNTAKWAIQNGLWVERHYTLGKNLPGKDHKISSTPEEFEELMNEYRYIGKVEAYKTRWVSAQ